MYDRNKSLEELEADYRTKSGFDSGLVTISESLFQKPLSEFTVENLRILIGQNIGLKFLIPIAIEHLEENLFVQGDYYPGDLLWSVLSIEPDYWNEYPENYWKIRELTGGLSSIFSKLNTAIKKFEQIKLLN